MSLPFVTHENQIKVFNFYQQGNIYQATFFRRQLHKLVRFFELDDRTAAYRVGYDLAENTISVLITVSIDGYKVWTDLRSEAKPLSIAQLEPLSRQSPPLSFDMGHFLDPKLSSPDSSMST